MIITFCLVDARSVTRDEAVEWEEHREQNLEWRRGILKQLEDNGIDTSKLVRVMRSQHKLKSAFSMDEKCILMESNQTS